jgi:hypothetical protein
VLSFKASQVLKNAINDGLRASEPSSSASGIEPQAPR